MRLVLPYALAAASGLLLAAAFPPLEWSWAAWIALLPLLWASRDSRPRRAAGLGFVAGTVFWLTSIWWLTKVTAAGWVGLCLYCALYFMPFAAIVASWRVRFPDAGVWARLALLAGGTAVWTAGEFIRSNLFTGFAWNPVGVSQSANLTLIQHAEWGGVYAVSALVVWVNLAAFLLLTRMAARGRGERPGLAPDSMLATAVVVAAIASGAQLFHRVPPPDARVRLALVQPAIPQYQKWTDEFIDEMYARLRDLTDAALRSGRPDLVVWPETAVPEDLRASEEACDLLRPLTAYGVPLLVGAMDSERMDTGEVLYYNSAFLVGPGVSLLEQYDKQHRVIFGEYVPLQRYFPWLKTLTPIQYYVSPGKKATVFHLPRPELRFSVLICFEDTVAHLARDFVRRGASLLVNITNDAWFDPTSGSRQHMLHCVLRGVENRVPIARCGNSGVTCWIDERGRIGGANGAKAGTLPVFAAPRVMARGFLSAEIPYRSDGAPPTFYARHGDVFAWAMTVLAAGFGLLVGRRGVARPALQG